MSSILIKNAYIVSMVSPISKADVYIENGRIKEIGIIQWLKRIGVNDESVSNYKFGNGDFFNLHFYL